MQMSDSGKKEQVIETNRDQIRHRHRDMDLIGRAAVTSVSGSVSSSSISRGNNNLATTSSTEMIL